MTLAPSGTEGGSDIGTMRWAQTASYGRGGVIPNTFVAQGYDLNDPFRNDSCYGTFKCHDNTPAPPGGWGRGCDEYCASVKTTNWYMGPIHPRDKKPVGARLAKLGAVVAYKKKGWSNGPTIAGCSVAAGKVTIRFNATLMAEGGADAISLQPYYRGNETDEHGKPITTIGSLLLGIRQPLRAAPLLLGFRELGRLHLAPCVPSLRRRLTWRSLELDPARVPRLPLQWFVGVAQLEAQASRWLASCGSRKRVARIRPRASR